MSHKHILRVVAVLALVAALAAGGVALAQTSTHYNLQWHLIAAGRPVASPHYAVNASAGQGAASPPELVSKHFVVSGGYWYIGMAPSLAVYLPLVVRGTP